MLRTIPKNIKNLANGLARKSPRLSCRKRHSIKSIQCLLRQLNPGALAQPISQIFNVLRYNWKYAAFAVVITLLAVITTSCYRMPTPNDYSVIPVTNNRDITGEGEKDENNVLPTMNY